jgi:hypothetical protein
MRSPLLGSILVLGCALCSCDKPPENTIQGTDLAAQGVPETLVAEWVTDVYGRTWLSIDWDAMRAELLHPDASDSAVQLDCAEIGLADIATVPGACAVPGSPDPDDLIAQGKLADVVWAVGFIDAIQVNVAVHYATRTSSWATGQAVLQPAKLTVLGTAVWGAVSCPDASNGTQAEPFLMARQLDGISVMPQVGPTRTAQDRVTDRAVRQGLGQSLETTGLAVDDQGVLRWSGIYGNSWIDTHVHWTTDTGLVGDADAAILSQESWRPATSALCQATVD